MKPGDHPEFFRFPAPEGRSRESTIVLSKEGRFFHDGEPVEHQGMHQAFASWLRRHPDDGRYILSNGYDWTYLTVEGPARFVQAVRDVDGSPQLLLLDGLEVRLEPSALRVDAQGRLSVALPQGEAAGETAGEPASFTAAAQLQLAPWLEERAGIIGLSVNGEFSPIASS